MAEKPEPANPRDEKSNQSDMTEAEIDRNLADTFPASDPPSWTLGTDHGHESTTPEPKDESKPE